LSCQEVNDNWSNGTWHSQQPESINYQLYANNSCLPDEVGSYSKAQGCKIGALPQYIVNTTQEADVAVAMKWAADRNIRIVVKGTGHDLNGRYVSLTSSMLKMGKLTTTCIDQAVPSHYPSGRATSAI
jgi:hypothetical protein